MGASDSPQMPAPPPAPQTGDTHPSQPHGHHTGPAFSPLSPSRRATSFYLLVSGAPLWW